MARFQPSLILSTARKSDDAGNAGTAPWQGFASTYSHCGVQHCRSAPLASFDSPALQAPHHQAAAATQGPFSPQAGAAASNDSCLMSFSPAPVAASQSTESSARPGGHQHNKQGLLSDASPVDAGGSPPSQPHRPWLANAHVLCGQASLPGGRYGKVNQDWVITLELHDSRQLRANGWPQCHLAVVLVSRRCAEPLWLL
jgi:hypothetical protein